MTPPPPSKRKGYTVPPEKPTEFTIKQRVHLILHTDSIAASDVNTFASAANILKADYTSHSGYKHHSIVVKKVSSGKEIVAAIDNKEFNDGSIVSLDIVSHGNQGGIHIARKLEKPEKAGFVQRKMHVFLRSNSDHPQTDEDAKEVEESMHGLYAGSTGATLVSWYYNQTERGDKNNDTEIRYISDINFKKFSADVFVEFHGCRTAEQLPVVNDLRDNFAKDFADNLASDARVVGHIVNAFPNKNPSGKSSDYRHGKVRVYSGGGKLEQDAVERYGLTFKNSSTPA